MVKPFFVTSPWIYEFMGLGETQKRGGGYMIIVYVCFPPFNPGLRYISYFLESSLPHELLIEVYDSEQPQRSLHWLTSEHFLRNIDWFYYFFSILNK